MVCAVVPRRLPVFGIIVTREDDNLGSAVGAFYLFRDLQTIFPGQFDVHENEIGTGRADQIQGLRAVPCLNQSQRREIVDQHPSQGMAKGIVVLDDKCPGHLRMQGSDVIIVVHASGKRLSQILGYDLNYFTGVPWYGK